MLGVLLASLTTLSAPPGLDRVADPPARWHASVQMGVGRLSEDAAAVVRPRLALDADSLTLALGAPLWLKVHGSPSAADDRSTWVRSWDDPQTWAALIEQASLQTAGASLHIAGLSKERLGAGVLLNDYESWLDPTRPRTGVRLDLAAESLGFALAALADSIVRPRLVGGEIGLAPLVLFGADPERRLRVILDGVADLRAPNGSGGRDPFGGSSLTGKWDALRGENLHIELWTAAGLLSQNAIGGHAGIELRLADDSQRDSLIVRCEGVRAASGYAPGWFDSAYEAERWALGHAEGRPKSQWTPPGGWWVRGSLDFEWGPVQAGISGDSALDGSLRAGLNARVETEVWSAAIMLMERDLRRVDDLLDFDNTTYTSAELAARIYDGLFAFTALHHGWRREAPGIQRVVTDWTMGIGWAAGDTI